MPTGLEEHHGEIPIGIGPRRLQRDRALDGRHALIGPPLARQTKTQPLARIGVIRRQRQRRAAVALGLQVLPLEEADEPCEVVGAQIVGLVGEHRVDPLDRLGVATLRSRGRGLVEADPGGCLRFSVRHGDALLLAIGCRAAHGSTRQARRHDVSASARTWAPLVDCFGRLRVRARAWNDASAAGSGWQTSTLRQTERELGSLAHVTSCKRTGSGHTQTGTSAACAHPDFRT